MTALILILLLLEGVCFLGVVKIIRLLQEEKSEPSVEKPRGTDFWQNIISYDHKKERRR